MPLAGGLSVTFPDPPMLEWQWTGAAGMGVTGIAGALQEAGINRRALWGLEEAWLRKTKRMRCGHANIMMHRAMWTYAVAIVYIMIIIYMF